MWYFHKAFRRIWLVAIVCGSTFQLAEAELNSGDFSLQQSLRRRELWGMLGRLPTDHVPSRAKLRSKGHVKPKRGDSYTVEFLELDLNGIETVPAILLIPDRRPAKAPGMLYMHWHGGDYAGGKHELIDGNRGLLTPYASLLASKGIVTLAIDSWCFGERNQSVLTNELEQSTFKRMLWQGRVLWGMMLWDEHQALSYLASRDEVDPERLGAMGMSMGATKAWWLAALDPRVKVCVDICCLTDFDELIKANRFDAHGIYYYVPDLLSKFNTSEINELIVPRARLSVNGRRDVLTPPAGVAKVRSHLLPLYEAFGRRDDCQIELFDCGHEETKAMRALVDASLDNKLVLRQAR